MPKYIQVGPKLPWGMKKAPMQPAGDDEQVLEAPEPVLDAGPGVARVPHPDHDHRHEEEEDGDDKADSIDSQISDGIFAFDALGYVLDTNFGTIMLYGVHDF